MCLKKLKDPPTAPRKPTDVSGMTDTSFTLSWQPPEKDGGAKIIEYTIEIYDTTIKKWTLYGTTRGDCTHISIQNLIKDRSYLFKICAKNESGTSPPLVTDEPIVAGKKQSKFYIIL